MSIIAEFTLPASAFALERTLREVPDLTVEIERLATHSREWVMPFLWATSDDLEAVETALREDPSVEDLRAIDVAGSVGYFSIEWDEEVQSLVDQVVDQHGIMQEAEATDGHWYFKLQFIDQASLKDFQQYFRDRGHTFELERLYDGTAPKEREYDLTPAQREVLIAALELGYFSVPRVAQIDDLAQELDISTNAVSQRLRRATGNLARNTLTVSTPKGAGENATES